MINSTDASLDALLTFSLWQREARELARLKLAARHEGQLFITGAADIAPANATEAAIRARL